MHRWRSRPPADVGWTLHTFVLWSRWDSQTLETGASPPETIDDGRPRSFQPQRRFLPTALERDIADGRCRLLGRGARH